MVSRELSYAWDKAFAPVAAREQRVVLAATFVELFAVAAQPETTRATVQACIELALTDVYGAGEQAIAWLTCIEPMLSHFNQVKVMGYEVGLVGFDLSNQALVALCRQGKRKARVSSDSVEFPEITPVEARWLQAWKCFSAGRS